MNLNPKIVLLYIISYLCIPLILIEIISQFVYADKVRSNGYFSRYFTSITPSSMRGGNQSILLQHSTLYSKDTYRSVKKVKFRTDAYGTIIPSTLAKVIEDINSKYYIFCGGSTTESGYIPEGARHVDIFARSKGINAVNAGNSGTDLYGCIRTLDYLLNKVGDNNMPKKIIISTNTNTLMSFIKSHKDERKANLGQNAKNIIKDKLLPGTYIVLARLKKSLLFNSKLWQSSLKDKFKSNMNSYEKYTRYEKALLMGCCYGPSQVNNNNEQIYDWESMKNLEFYLSYVSKGFIALEKFRLKHSLSKDKIIIFIEPNSFRYKNIGAKYDYRQNLFDKNLNQYSHKESGKIVSKYDQIYASQSMKFDFKVIKSPYYILSGNDFYDAVHLTPSGARKLSVYLEKRI